MNSSAGKPAPKLAAALEQILDQLLILPAVVSEVLGSDPEADDYFECLLDLAERDPTFAVRVLRCANSACNAPASPIVSLEQAVQWPGTEEDLDRVDDMHWASPQELVDVERAALGHDHALLGWHACQKWSLPAPIGEVVRRHHEPLSQDPGEPLNLIRIVQWADVLSVGCRCAPVLPRQRCREPPALQGRRAALFR